MKVKRTVTDEVTISVREFRKALGFRRWGIMRIVFPQPGGVEPNVTAMPERWSDEHKSMVVKFSQTWTVYKTRRLR